jgi:hypothetical protein
MVHGNMRSRNAQEAEEHAEMPLTRAVEAVYKSLECKKNRVSRHKIRAFLMQYCGCGWHHVAGPHGVRMVRYYVTALTDEQKRELLGTVTKEMEPAL